jgi:2-dehydro-3-deoxyphosphogluconate aldolase/(4S)-4-hydroxy-2-oxoglutarate aldolase
VRGVRIEQVVSLSEALLAGGIKMLEVTCNTKGVFEMIRVLCDKMGGPTGAFGSNDRMVIGAGTCITTDLCERALDAGARYIIAPDVNPDVIDYCVKRDVAILPGAATATEILTAKPPC